MARHSKMITLDDYLWHWKIDHGHIQVPDSELTLPMLEDAGNTVLRANELLDHFGEQRAIASGWRPVAVNKTIPRAALRSNHTMCRAIDLVDIQGTLGKWCLANLPVLEKIGLWLEHPSKCPTWTHLQVVPPRSGNRVFYP